MIHLEALLSLLDKQVGRPTTEDECGDIHSRVINTFSILSDTPITSIQKHDQQPTSIDYNKLKP